MTHANAFAILHALLSLGIAGVCLFRGEFNLSSIIRKAAGRAPEEGPSYDGSEIGLNTADTHLL